MEDVLMPTTSGSGKKKASKKKTAKKVSSKATAKKKSSKKVSKKAGKKVSKKASKKVGSRAVKASATKTISPEQRHAMIQEAAYYIAEQRGFDASSDMDDWLVAEAFIDGQLGD
jgi:hypothetical protein